MSATSQAANPSEERKRILTGFRPSGPAHAGHYAGALVHWERLQHEYEAFFLLADYQVSDYADRIDHVRWAVWRRWGWALNSQP